MGIQEKKVKRQRHLTVLKKTIIGMVALAVLLPVAAISANAIGAVGKIVGRERLNRLFSTKRSLSRLIDDGLVEFVQTRKGKFVRLTPAGKLVLLQIKYNEEGIKKPWRWDRKWRMVVFDVKEPRKVIRDKLRETFKRMNFYHLQKSVWVYPYDCEDFITLLKANYKIGLDLLYVIADSIEGDRKMRAYYDLPAK
jgi:CRISPR/Cas system-associated endoribonuclease Cas2